MFERRSEILKKRLLSATELAAITNLSDVDPSLARRAGEYSH